ncbi:MULTISPECIES: hypothetical protein [Bacillaceae]|uniref:YjgB family protein n=1 Tax=Evansella alkalicola TaxID=745819 RepID=A0ABS6K0N7_9BACI|nr:MULTISPECIES: hypothetical protein [Bacillaceae]MBU9724225.1 YjgB family protein [Bacillus alkalicola]
MLKYIAIIFLTSIITVGLTILGISYLSSDSSNNSILDRVQETFAEEGQDIVNKGSTKDRTLEEFLGYDFAVIGEPRDSVVQRFGEPIYDYIDTYDFLLNAERDHRLHIIFQENMVRTILPNVNLEGDKEDLMRLGEKMLPADAVFYEELERIDETEHRNSSTRNFYTRTDFEYEKYYHSPSLNKVLSIKVSKSERSDREERNRWELRVSRLTAFDNNFGRISELVRNDSQNESVSSESETVQHEEAAVEETTSYADDAQAQFNEWRESYFQYIEENMDELLANNEIVRKDNFRVQAQFGTMEGVNYGIGTSIQALIQQHGEPVSSSGYRGGKLLQFDFCNCSIAVPYEYDVYDFEDRIVSFHFNIYMTKSEVMEALGEPDYAFFDEGYSFVNHIQYEIGEYLVDFQESEHEEGIYYYVAIRQNNR